MNKEEVRMAFARNNPITINSIDCHWDWKYRILTVKGENWSGYIRPEEMGVKFQYSNGKIPDNIASFLSNTEKFKATVIEETESGKFIFSRKVYQEACKSKLEIGKIYEAEVRSVCDWGVFCEIDAAKVFIHISELSTCRFDELEKSKAFQEGMKFPVKILKKELGQDGKLYVSASRRAASEDKRYISGDIVKVIIGSKVKSNDGFYCEVTPNKAGIIDVPLRYMHIIKEGELILGVIRKVTDQGYKIKSLISYTDK